MAAESVGKSAGAVGTNLDVRAAQQTSGTRSYASNFDHHSLATPPHDPACMVPKLVIISAKMADTWYDAPCFGPHALCRHGCHRLARAVCVRCVVRVALAKRIQKKHYNKLAKGQVKISNLPLDDEGGGRPKRRRAPTLGRLHYLRETFVVV